MWPRSNFFSLKFLKGFILTSVWAHIQVPARPCDIGTLELRRSQRTPTDCPATRLDAQRASGLLFALCPGPKSKEQKCHSKFWLSPEMRRDFPSSSFFECLVWNTDPAASGLSLASPRSRQPTLESSYVDVTGCRRPCRIGQRYIEPQSIWDI